MNKHKIESLFKYIKIIYTTRRSVVSHLIFLEYKIAASGPWWTVHSSLIWTLKCWSTCEIQNVLEASSFVSWKPEPDVVYFCFCSSEQTRIYLRANKRKAWSANIDRTKNSQKFQSTCRRFFCLFDRILDVSFENYPIKSICPINIGASKPGFGGRRHRRNYGIKSAARFKTVKSAKCA